MEFNFGVTSDQSTGSILMVGQAWNLTVNDAWLLGGAHAHQPFYLAFKKSYSNIFTDNLEHTLTITGREPLGLLLSGYHLQVGGDALGDVMVCKDTTKADQMMLVKYAVAAQVFEQPLVGNEAIINSNKDPATRKLILKDLTDGIEAAIREVGDLKGRYVETARAATFNLALA
jgi:hypothetical protein